MTARSRDTSSGSPRGTTTKRSPPTARASRCDPPQTYARRIPPCDDVRGDVRDARDVSPQPRVPPPSNRHSPSSPPPALLGNLAVRNALGVCDGRRLVLLRRESARSASIASTSIAAPAVLRRSRLSPPSSPPAVPTQRVFSGRHFSIPRVLTTVCAAHCHALHTAPARATALRPSSGDSGQHRSRSASSAAMMFRIGSASNGPGRAGCHRSSASLPGLYVWTRPRPRRRRWICWTSRPPPRRRLSLSRRRCQPRRARCRSSPGAGGPNTPRRRSFASFCSSPCRSVSRTRSW